MNYILSIVIGYGFGCIQAAYLISKIILKEDIRSKGNGNAGASNMTVAYGKKFGLAVAVIDIVKAIVALYFVRLLIMPEGMIWDYLYITGLFVIIGHNYPFYMGFKGGKGTASLIGLLLGLSPQIGLIGLVAFFAMTFVTDYIVMGTFGLLTTFVVVTVMNGYGTTPVLVSVVVALLSVYKHRENIVKMRNREEKSVRASLKKKRTV